MRVLVSFHNLTIHFCRYNGEDSCISLELQAWHVILYSMLFLSITPVDLLNHGGSRRMEHLRNGNGKNISKLPQLGKSIQQNEHRLALSEIQPADNSSGPDSLVEFESKDKFGNKYTHPRGKLK